MPIEWEEPFGIVMVEAMACGTPVIGFKRGSVPEVVHHGLTGFVCHDRREMIAAVTSISSINRVLVRYAYEQRFSDRVIVNHYENLYHTLVANKK